jgi:hypothetical protein
VGIQRKTKFGFPPSAAAPSTTTVRMVPLTQGVRGDVPWTDLPPGSAISMTNLLPIDGCLIPRSRLSSLNTIQVSGQTIIGMALLPSNGILGHEIWYSSKTHHGVLNSTGSFSRASLTSAFGLGGIPTAQDSWQYAEAFAASIDANVLIAAGGSWTTLLALYRIGGNGAPAYSFVTAAPIAACVGSHDNYVIAMNIRPSVAGAVYNTRVQWCARGEPLSGWTKEGSGFEDLLAMRGTGSAVKGLSDGRVVLFSDLEIWYGVTAPYPAQFQFQPLDSGVGCPAPGTIAETEHGLVFVGTDLNLRVLPTGGGASRVVAPSLHRLLRNNLKTTGLAGFNNLSWAVWDTNTKIYYLFIQQVGSITIDPTFAVAVNIDTGEWGFVDFAPFPTAAVAQTKSRVGNFASSEGLMFGNSRGTFYSYSSTLGTDSGSTVTATWRSAPVASELPANYKQLKRVDCDYRATSRATVTLKISQDGGGSYGHTAMPLSLLSAPVTGRASSDVYAGSAFPCIELSSTDTGYELHRLDVTLDIGGQR